MQLTKIKLLALLFLFTLSSYSQVLDFTQKIPVDSSIRIGILSNGLKYYLKYNPKPEKRIELRLAVNAGSILEDTDQLGLAHFTEHMAFNGTKHFAKNEMISYLQSVGVRFGADINAYTSFDETVYMLQIPSDKNDIIKKGIRVLRDWAHALTFDSLELEKERGVVIEEWRIGRGAEQRMRDKYFPVLFHNSRYAVRLPIGTLENLETFKRNSIVRFYNDWYRPDLMAVIVVGDIDVNAFEKMIKDNFSDIPKKINERPRINYSIPDHKETLVSITSDKEAANTTVSLFYMHDDKPEITIGDFREYAKNLLYFQMFNERLSDIARSPKPPYIAAQASYGNIIARGKDALILQSLVSDTGIITATKTLARENELARQYGFTNSELERAKKQLLSSYEKIYLERDKTESDNFADEYIRNFLNKEPIPGITFEYNFIKKYLPQVTIEDMNNQAKEYVIDTNRVVIVTAPQKEGLKLPDENEVLAAIKGVSEEKLENRKDLSDTAKLMSQKPKPGQIKSTKNYNEIGVSEINLSNGVKVYLKPTDFKNDEIVLSAISAGGQYLYPDSDNFSAYFASQIIIESGLATFTLSDLQKLLAGKTVSATPYINSYTEGIKASCTPKDIETMFQLINLYFTQPRKDSLAFLSFANRTKAYLKDISSNPLVYYSDQLTKVLTQNNPRGGGVPKPSDIDKINLSRAYNIYKERFADAGDFIFEIVGNFNTDSIKIMLETYIASLPSLNKKENWKDIGIRPPKGSVTKNIYKGTDPKSYVTLVYTDSANYSTRDAYLLKSLSEFMNIRLVEVLREEKSGVYGIRSSATLGRIPYGSYNITIKFPCAPSNVDSLVNEAIKIEYTLKAKGISRKNLKKIKEAQLRERELNIKSNSYWLAYLESTFFNNDNPLRIVDQEKTIKKLKAKDLKQTAKKYFTDDLIKVVLYPEEMEKK